MKLLIIGAPGAGKGTQASRIAEHYDVPAISTGAMFRQNIADGTELGRQVQAIMAAGELVSDEITDQIVANRLGEPDAASGWLLDGYPRNLHQVEVLDELLGASDAGLDAVIALQVSEDVLVERLLQRAAIEGRADDNEQTIRNRMKVYQAETAPLMDAYRDRNLLVEVDGLGEVDQITKNVIAALDAFVAR